MRTYLVAFALALIVSALATPLVAWFAHRLNWLDEPNEERKVHDTPIPRLGGVAVVFAFFTPILGLFLYENRVSDLLYSDQRLVTGLFGGALAIVALGVYDDLKGADAKLKLIVQSTVALGLWMCGFRIELLGNPLGTAFSLGILSLPITMLWIVGVINALNLIDGLDGLASGVALLATIVLFGVAFVDNATLLCLITVALGGSLVGFLFWNFNPAKIFLGDSGSMFLGFILSTISIWTQQKGATAAALLIPVLALGLPILDTALSFLRRVRKGKSPFQADREHLHHRLLALGLSHRSAVLTLYTMSIVFCLGALSMLEADATRRAIALSTVVVVVVILIRHVGVFRQPGFQISPHVTANRDEVRRVVRAVRSARTPDEAWTRVMPLFASLDAEAVRLTWLSEDDRPSDSRCRVFFWRRDRGPGQSMPFEHAMRRMEVHPNALIRHLGYETRHLGEFVMVFGRGTDPRQDPQLAIYLELLAESLVEHRIGSQVTFPADVVHLQEARLSQVSSL